MKLTHVQIEKYKCYDSPQEFVVDNDITVLVGKNEAGKTAVLESIAKTNYFTDDKAFKFDAVLDYPRKEKKKYDKVGKVGVVVRAKYAIDDELFEEIATELGEGVFEAREITITTKYDNSKSIGGVSANREAFLTQQAAEFGLEGGDLEGWTFARTQKTMGR